MKMKMTLKGLLLFCFILFVIAADPGDALTMNPNIVRSIKSQDGDVIDCVHASHQPAFDHPLLKNHAIKMLPSHHPEGESAMSKLTNSESNDNNNQITQLWQLSGECPEGTIPIRRTEKRASSIRKKHRNSPRAFSSMDTDAVSQSRHEYAYTYTPTSETGEYYGTKATISAWQPQVERVNEFSLSQLWIIGGSGPNRNTIEVGWIVYPQIFKDSLTRLFVYWTRDNYQSTGCYNLFCSGFVQTSKNVAVGASISTAGNQPEITLLVWKDENQHVWWLQYNGEILGYWPATIFTVLNNGTSTLVEWGGEIVNSNIDGRHTATQMGSGRFPEAGFGRASYFKNLWVVDNSNTLRQPSIIGSAASYPNCYNVTAGKNSDWGNFFYYGGPGRNPNCP